jgi:Uma2 family endonuclease
MGHLRPDGATCAVKVQRIRVPDITVLLGGLPPDQIIRTPPFICIEILSPSDRTSEMQERIDDYLEFGVPHAWVVNPINRRAFIYTPGKMHEAKDGILTTCNPDIRVPLAELE